MEFGKYQLPESLCPGAILDGFKVESLEQVEYGIIWKFSKHNMLFILQMPYDEFFDLLASPHNRDAVVDGMCRALNHKYAESMGITIVRSH